MALLAGSHTKWTRKHYDTPSGTWKPNLAPNAPEYQPQQPKGRSLKGQKWLEARAFDRNAWGALGEVVMMAEASQDVSLGRVVRKKRSA